MNFIAGICTVLSWSASEAYFRQTEALPTDATKTEIGRLDGGNYPKSLFFVGTVEGKSFFADTRASMTWEEAREYCEGTGMKLASITSQVQLTFLNEVRHDDFFAWYWISARDSQKLRQFSWHYDDSELDSSYLELRAGFGPGIQTCLYYSKGISTLSPTICRGQYGVLCELQV